MAFSEREQWYYGAKWLGMMVCERKARVAREELLKKLRLMEQQLAEAKAKLTGMAAQTK